MNKILYSIIAFGLLLCLPVSAVTLPTTSSDYYCSVSNCNLGSDGDMNTNTGDNDGGIWIYNYTFVDGIPDRLNATFILYNIYYQNGITKFYCFNTSNTWEQFITISTYPTTGGFYVLATAEVPTSCKIGDSKVSLKFDGEFAESGNIAMTDIVFSDLAVPKVATNYECDGEGVAIVDCDKGADGDFTTYTYNGDSWWSYNYTFSEGLGQKVVYYLYVEDVPAPKNITCYNGVSYESIGYNDTSSTGWITGEIPSNCLLANNIVNMKTQDNPYSLTTKHFHDTFFRGEAGSPTITITYPLNQTYNYTVNTINWEVTNYPIGENLTCRYSTNGGITKTEVACFDNTAIVSPIWTNTWSMYLTKEGPYSDIETADYACNGMDTNCANGFDNNLSTYAEQTSMAWEVYGNYTYHGGYPTVYSWYEYDTEGAYFYTACYNGTGYENFEQGYRVGYCGTLPCNTNSYGLGISSNCADWSAGSGILALELYTTNANGNTWFYGFNVVGDAYDLLSNDSVTYSEEIPFVPPALPNVTLTGYVCMGGSGSCGGDLSKAFDNDTSTYPDWMWDVGNWYIGWEARLGWENNPLISIYLQTSGENGTVYFSCYNETTSSYVSMGNYSLNGVARNVTLTYLIPFQCFMNNWGGPLTPPKQHLEFDVQSNTGSFTIGEFTFSEESPEPSGNIYVSATYTYPTYDPNLAQSADSTTAGLSTSTDFFSTFIVLAAMVVLVLLTVLIINSIRKSGVTQEGA